MPADPVIELVNRSHQRGGRMLSVVDLVAADTLTMEQACWLLVRILDGSSWLVGANPGGAGKTAVPITVGGESFSAKRTVKRIHHVESEQWQDVARDAHAPSAREREIGAFIEDCLVRDVKTVGDVRRAWLDWLRKCPEQTVGPN